MRIVKLPEFRTLPENTLFVKAEQPWAWQEPMVKGETLSHDFVSMDLYEIESTGSDQLFDRWGEMLETGSSYPLDIDTGGRDGLFEADAIFMVYEKADLEKLRTLIDRAIANEEHHDRA